MKPSDYLLLVLSSIALIFGCGDNTEPQINQLIAPDAVVAGGQAIFRVIASDPDGDTLTYVWTVNGEVLRDTTAVVEWSVPEGIDGKITVEVQVSDGENDPVLGQKTVTVVQSRLEPPPKIVPPVDISRHSVPLEDIYFDTFQPINRAVPLSKATPELLEELRDAIPPIHNPKYEPAAGATWLKDADVIVGYAAGGRAWAYPVRILNWHEIVNETHVGEPTLISYCPLCFSGIVFSRRLGNRVLTFGNTSALYESDMVMFDYETGSYWWQVAGRAIVGTLTDEMLTVLPSMTATWGEWSELYPRTLVLSRDTGFGRDYGANLFADYPESLNDGRFAFPVSDAGKDARLSPGERVLVVKVGADVKGYPVAKLGHSAIMDTVGGRQVIVFIEAGAGAVYQPIAAGQNLTFDLQNGRFTDRETGSIWNLAGRSVDGLLKGTELSPIPTKTTFWFSIAAAEPGIRVYQR